MDGLSGRGMGDGEGGMGIYEDIGVGDWGARGCSFCCDFEEEGCGWDLGFLRRRDVRGI